MKKRKALIIGTLVTCLLTGCCMSHEWKEATCSDPKTCTKCGETQGEALGHTWIDATCAEPKTCSVCGETEGETLAHSWADATCTEAKHCNVCGETEGNALEHTLTEANYQQAATCEVCGETVGEPLQAYFEKYGLVCNSELDTTFPFVLQCNNNDEYTTEGKLTFSDYEVFESDDTHEALEGYEWRAVTYTLIFDDENARDYGFKSFYAGESDYYYDDETIDTLNYNGVDYLAAEIDRETLQSGWNDQVYTAQTRMYVRVPQGYDGAVIGVLKRIDWDNIRELADTPDDVIFFRLK